MNRQSILRAAHPEQGYTVMEVLVSLTLLGMLLMPFGYIVSYWLASPNNRKIIAINLAERELEYCLLSQQFKNRRYSRQGNGTRFRIERNVTARQNLWQIEVAVYQEGNPHPLVRLYRLQRQTAFNQELFH